MKRPQVNKSGPGCLILFALPFAGVGLFMAGLVLWNVGEALAMRSWHAVPATITDLALEHHQDNEGGSTASVRAAYTYVWEGQTYHGDRVAIATGSDNIGSYWPELYQRLDQERRRPVGIETESGGARCWVNPKAPEQAVLDRSLRWGLLGFKALFGMVFGGFGGWLMWLSLSQMRQAHRLAQASRGSWCTEAAWLTSRIPGQGSMLGVWIFFSVAMAIAVVTGILGNWPNVILGEPPLLTLIVGALVLLGLGLWRGTWRRLTARLAEGQPHLELDVMPVEQGQSVTARLQARRPLGQASAVRCIVTCTEVFRSENSDESPPNNLLWRHGWTIPVPTPRPGATAWELALEIPIPRDLVPSGGVLTWTLEVRSTTPGSVSVVTFPLPVVPAQDAQQQLKTVDLVVPAVLDPLEAVSRYRDLALERTTTRDGLRLVKPPWREKAGVVAGLIVGLFIALIAGAGVLGVLAGNSDARIVGAALCGVISAVGLLLAGYLIRSLVTTFVLEVDNQGLSQASGLLVAGPAQRFRRTDIKALRTRCQKRDRHDLILELVDGRIVPLTPVLGVRDDVAWVAQDLWQALGHGLQPGISD